MSTVPRVALVTGGGRGIGRSIALALAEEGMDVAVSARSADQLESVALEIEQLGRRALALPCDVTDREAVFEAVAQAEQDLGPVDVLVNNAGITHSAKFLAVDLDTWQQVMDVNLNGAIYCIQATLPGMQQRGWGRIINVASMAGVRAIPYATPYVASKHALVGLTRGLALENIRRGVTVNAVCPGWVETEMSEKSVQAISENTGISHEQALQAVTSMNVQKRLLHPDEIAHVTRLLVGEAGRSITGQALVVDGGSVPGNV